ncbi:organic solvent tolerance protein [Pseudobdellovibrio sp. HCB154]|uniref:organic solvent tolerance protein n=1 Tax=Pseudobdellovibrio sp. HCB154 TaxID=3386277 RepID=UPI003916DD0E
MKLLKITLTIAIMSLFSSLVSAKEMPQRLGVGIKNNTSESLPSLAAVYHLNGLTAVTGGIGVDTQKDNSKFQINAGIRHVIFHENQLHYYAGGQLGLVTFEDPIDGKENGFEANFLMGVEFFFTGLENVGFSFEGGLGLSSVKDTRIRTLADDPFRAGIIFYF